MDPFNFPLDEEDVATLYAYDQIVSEERNNEISKQNNSISKNNACCSSLIVIFLIATVFCLII